MTNIVQAADSSAAAASKASQQDASPELTARDAVDHDDNNSNADDDEGEDDDDEEQEADDNAQDGSVAEENEQDDAEEEDEEEESDVGGDVGLSYLLEDVSGSPHSYRLKHADLLGSTARDSTMTTTRTMTTLKSRTTKTTTTIQVCAPSSPTHFPHTLTLPLSVHLLHCRRDPRVGRRGQHTRIESQAQEALHRHHFRQAHTRLHLTLLALSEV